MLQGTISFLFLFLLYLLTCAAFFHVPICIQQRIIPSAIHRVFGSSSSKRVGAASDLPEDANLCPEYELDDELREDKELERRMAEQLYNDLKGDDSLLTKEKFIKWEDIDELLSRGAFDGETLEIIYTECGVSGENINFEQFLEVVDLVNQVSAVLDQDIQSVLNDDLETEIIDDEDDTDQGLPGIDLSWMPKSIQ